MGHIKKLLAFEQIEPRSITATSVWGDLCENIHLHHRNLRIDFDQKEWAHLRYAINNIGMAMEHQMERYQYKEGDSNFLISIAANEPVHRNSAYYPNRVSIELQKDDTIHFHYRDIRLHWTLSEFNRIADMFMRSWYEFTSMKTWPYGDIKQPTEISVDMDLICPWDHGHRPGEIDAEHRAGIEYCKNLIREGKKIRPILMNTDGSRMDGFKRYMAHKELGLEKINCIIDPHATMGGQKRQSMVADD